MKKLFSISTCCLLSQVTYAADDCGRNFGQQVAACAYGPNELRNACTQDAKVAKVACQSGVNTCLNTCQTTYNTTVSNCNTNNDPGLCGGILDCENVIIELRNACLNTAQSTFSACQVSCQ